MLNRKFTALGVAAAAALPFVGRAATITFSYDPNDFGYYAASDTAFATFIPVSNTGTAAAPKISVPAGATVVFGVDGLVTGSDNSTAAASAYSTGKVAQPANLGLGSFGLGFNVSGGSFDLANFPANIINPPYSTQTTGITNGLGGIAPNGVAGAFNGAGQSATSSTGAAAIGYAGGTAAELFNTLGVKVTGNGTITPISTPGAFTYITYVSGGTSKTNAPTYAQVTAVSGVDTINMLPALTVSTGAPPTGHSIIALTGTGTTPTSYGSQLTAPAGTATFNPGSATSTAITVTKIGPNSYIPGRASVVAAGGSSQAYVQVNGFTPATDQEVYALRLLVGGVAPTPAQIGQIIQDINSQTGTNVVASTVPTNYYNVFSPTVYNIMLTASTGVGTSTFLGFDFSQDTNVAGVTVSQIAAVPEPATIAGLLIGAGTLLSGRRRRSA